MKLTEAVAIVLDTGPLGLLTAPVGHKQGDLCKAWYDDLETFGCDFFVPEIADFELRRELIRSNKAASIIKLDDFNNAISYRYLPLTTTDVQHAASLWAKARNIGLGGAPPEALDGDTLIAAQAERVLPFSTVTVIVATTNPSHLAYLTTAELWSDIRL